MNPYQIIGVIVICTLIFAAIVAGLTFAGLPLLVAFAGVYLTTIWVMVGMQKRARQTADMQRYRSTRQDASAFECVRGTRVSAGSVAANSSHRLASRHLAPPIINVAGRMSANDETLAV